MNINIKLFSDSNAIGKIVFFVYETGAKEGYACASVEWSPYIPGEVRLRKYIDKKPEFKITRHKNIPWDDINTIIKETVEQQFNISVDNINFLYKNKIHSLEKCIR